ncbi:MAG: hypothetical protein J6Y02_19465 [Pseudobutyrivibrio sp.]|nr:hypothetical protein [Pseudobutyrivibrio sp.]
MSNNDRKLIAPSDKSCADCAYHHCKETCRKYNKNYSFCKNDGECLFTGEVNRKCWEGRCEHFKLWRRQT